MKFTRTLSLILLLLSIFHSQVSGQVKDNYDPYFIETTDTVSKYGPWHITRDLLQDKDNNFWFATWMGIVKYDGEFFTNYTLKENLIHFHVVCCYEDKKGNLWFGTARGGAYVYDGNSFTLFTTKDGLVDNNISCILEDKAGNIWFGTENGVSRYDGKTFTNFTKDDGFTGKYANCMIQDKTGKMWVGTGEGLYHINGKSVTGFPNKEGLPFKRVTGLLEDKKGNIWIGRMDGLTLYDGKSFTDVLSNFLTYYIIEDNAGNVLFTHCEPNTEYPDLPNQVLYRYDGENYTKIIEKNKPNDFQLFGKTVDRNGNIWFGTMHGPCRYDGKSFTYFTK